MGPNEKLNAAWEQLSELREKGTRQRFDSEILRKESVRLWAESERTRLRHNQLWENEVKANGITSQFHWKFISLETGYICVFENGDVYSPGPLTPDSIGHALRRKS